MREYERNCAHNRCMDAITARRLTSGDIQLARQTFTLMAREFGEEDRPLGDDYLQRLLERPEFWVIAAIVDGEVVGGLTAHTLPMTRAETAEIFIYDIAVRSDRQRRGVGRRLIETLHHVAASRGIECVFVAADNDDEAALEFYRALGGNATSVTYFGFPVR